MKKLLNLQILIALFTFCSINAATLKPIYNSIPDEILKKNQFINQKIDSQHINKYSLHIKFKSEVFDYDSESKIRDILSKYIDLKNISKINFPFQNPNSLMSKDKIGVFRISEIFFNKEISPVELSIQLMTDSLIEYSTPIYNRYTHKIDVNDPLLSSQYALQSINIDSAWAITTGDTSIIIAIVDTGTDFLHSDLKANIYINKGEIPNNNIDDDQNGKIDDVTGWDFVGNVTSQDLQTGKYKPDNNPTNLSQFHGTHVAGCASAVTNNSLGIASPGFNLKILPIKCASDAGNVPGVHKGYEAIYYAAISGAKVINCSWGGPGSSPSEQDIINFATDKGAVIVTAAGNAGKYIDFFQEFPACYENVVCVGATGPNNSIANFTNYGNKVKIYAPGADILSTMPNENYGNQNGTSMSSPIVAGVVGLIKSIHPDWNTSMINAQLRATANKNLPVPDNSKPYFFGSINAYRALLYNNGDDNKTFPGIKVLSYNVEKTLKTINNFGKNSISVSLTNILSSTTDLKIKISPVDDYVSVTTHEFLIDSFLNLDNIDIDFDIFIEDNCPWFSGSAKVLMTFEKDDYLDYHILYIPLSLPTNNVSKKMYEIPQNLMLMPYNAHSPSKNVYYQVSHSLFLGSILFSYINNVQSSDAINSEPAYCVYGFDKDNAIVGFSPSTGMSKIGFYSNHSIRKTINTNTITPFINAIHFYDKKEGILLGDPNTNTKRWGVAKTLDSGKTWNLIDNIPIPMGAETGFVEAVDFQNDNIWFGSSIGRIFVSNDKGNTWRKSNTQLGNSITKISFMNKDLGFALFRVGSGNTAKPFLAYTLDGGSNWINMNFDFIANNISPINIHCVPNAQRLILLTSNNEILESIDTAKTWKNVLTTEMYDIVFGYGFNEGNTMRIWSASQTSLSYLDAKFQPLVEMKELTLLSSNPLIFKKTEIDKFNYSMVTIKNTGNVPITFDSYKFEYENEQDTNSFIIENFPVNSNIEPIEQINFNIKFQPKRLGVHNAKLIITSNNSPNNMEIQLQGEGTDNTSVYDNNEPMFRVLPNPSFDYLEVNFGLNNEYDYQIIDVKGKEIVNGKNLESTMTIDISKLNNGIYYLIIDSNGKKYSKNFVKLK